VEFPVPEEVTDLLWWDEKTTKQTFDWCPGCLPLVDDRMADVRYCYLHATEPAGDPEATDRVTAPFTAPVVYYSL